MPNPLKKLPLSGLLCLVFIVLSACEQPNNENKRLARELKPVTTSVAIISGMAKLCGVTGIQEYRQAYINHLNSQIVMSDDYENQIRARFKEIDKNLAKDFAQPHKRREQCRKHGTGEAAILRGIGGDFSGQY